MHTSKVSTYCDYYISMTDIQTQTHLVTTTDCHMQGTDTEVKMTTWLWYCEDELLEKITATVLAEARYSQPWASEYGVGLTCGKRYFCLYGIYFYIRTLNKTEPLFRSQSPVMTASENDIVSLFDVYLLVLQWEQSIAIQFPKWPKWLR